jgi:DNA gyrase/topoisomerase IV subunit A
MIVRIHAVDVRQTHRGSAGVRVVNIAQGDSLAGVARVKDEEDSPDANDAASDTGEAPPPEGD